MDEALTAVGLRPEDVLGRFPHQLSGGQRQRINVARALLLKPRLLVADEPVSMVDASLRATILETLRNLQRDHGVSIIYITHDLTTAYHVANNDHRALPRRGDGERRCRHGDQEPAAPLYAAPGRLDPLAESRPALGRDVGAGPAMPRVSEPSFESAVSCSILPIDPVGGRIASEPH